MDALAPAALALTVTFDAVATLGLTLMSYDGPFLRAMLPMTQDARMNLASQLADLLVASVVRGGCALLPMLGYGSALSPVGLAMGGVISCGMTAFMATKAFLAYQLSEDHLLFVKEAGVTIHVPMVIAAEVLAIFMSWFVFTLVWFNRHVMKQPAAADPFALALAYTNSQIQQQRLAVQNWLASSDLEAPADVAEPLLDPEDWQQEGELDAMRPQGSAGSAWLPGGEDAASFKTALSRAATTDTNCQSAVSDPQQQQEQEQE